MHGDASYAGTYGRFDQLEKDSRGGLYVMIEPPLTLTGPRVFALHASKLESAAILGALIPGPAADGPRMAGTALESSS